MIGFDPIADFTCKTIKQNQSTKKISYDESYLEQYGYCRKRRDDYCRVILLFSAPLGEV